MARARKQDLAVKKDNLPANWEEQMMQDAEAAANMEARIGSSQFFSTKGGVLKYNDSPIPGNQMAVIVLDYVHEKTYYEDDYDPDNPASPVCFAFGRGDEQDLVPHADSADPQNDKCHGCEWNEFGSADRGQGKACKDARRLGLIAAGKLDGDDWEISEDPEYYEAQQVALLRLPPTSLKAWATYVKKLKGAMGRPPYGVVTLIKVVPDEKNQFSITFDYLGKIPNEIGPTIMQMHSEAQEPGIIDFPYQAMTEQEEKPARGRRKPAGGAKKKRVAKKKSTRRARKY
jgi:hypothetical protein